jgi:hypothetical protein
MTIGYAADTSADPAFAQVSMRTSTGAMRWTSSLAGAT